MAQGTNGQVTGALANITSYLSDVNITGNHGTVANGQSVNLTGDPAYFQDVNRPMYNYNGAFAAAPFGNSNLIGQVSEFTSITRVTGTSARLASEFVFPAP